jgi:hypothetical protein
MTDQVRRLRLTQSNATGFVNIEPQDPLTAEINDENPLSADYIQWHIPSIYEGTTYSIDLTANVQYYQDDVLVGSLPVRSISTSYDFGQHGMTANVISSDTLRLSGQFANVFLDSYFEFVLDNGSTVQLEPNVNSSFKALVEYEMPDNTVIDLEFPFNFTVNTEFASMVTVSDTKNVGQWVVWRFDSAAALIQQLVDSRPNA